MKMSEAGVGTPPPRSFWITAIVALLWNLIGVMSYLSSVMISPEALGAMPEAERALFEDIPAWVTASYAIAVFGGTIASVVLLARRRWSTVLFAVSLVAILVQMSHQFFMTPAIEVLGASSAVLPVMIILVAAWLVWFSSAAGQRGWLR